MSEVSTYDYVIVGGGTAGVVLATRLAAGGAGGVALLEAGPSDVGRSEVLEVRDWMDLLAGELDYDYAIEPQPRGNGLIRHSRARVLGGCSSHNSCIAFQPPDADLRRWEELGATGWGPADTARCYERVWATVGVCEPGGRNPLNRAIIAASAQAGLPATSFADGRPREGAAPFRLNVVEGRRQSASVAYLHDRQQPAGLDVRTDTRVLGLRFAGPGSRAVTGVETTRGPIDARAEVVLCAGAFDSPKLLLLSGIGPGRALQDLGIEVRRDLPGVGEHLLDHPEGVVAFESTRPVPEPVSQLWEVGIFATVDPGAAAPDLMLHAGLMPFTMNTEPAGYPTAEHGFSLTPNVALARSEGTVRLRSADPADPPVIDFRYFTDPDGYDERIMLAGARLARRIGAQPALDGWRRRELAPGPEVGDDADLSAYIRETANTVYHPAGTCRMGAPEDAGTVVAPDLRVLGVDGLRVCDASIFPAMPSINPGITCMMLGERAAELIGQGRP